MADSSHSDINGIRAAWQSVATDLDRDAETCRVAWRSLRQSYRYHCKAANNRKKFDLDLEDCTADPDPLATPDIKWEFADEMAFLQDMSRERHVDLTPSEEEISNDDTVNEDYEEYTDMEFLEDVDEASSLDAEIAHVCRTCLQPLDAQAAQNLFEADNYKLLEQIQALTSLSLEQDENMSNFICEGCLSSLEAASEFRRICIDAQQQMLSEIQVENISEHNTSTAGKDQLEDVNIRDSENECQISIEIKPVSPSSVPPTPSKSRRTKLQKFQCHECGLTFKSTDLLKMHMHEQHQQQLQTRFVCRHCGHDFKYSAPLVEHLKRIGVSFAYKCDACGQKFHSRHFLKKHKRRAHGLTDEHICHICGKNFTTAFNLRNHLVRHTGSRPNKCQLCPAAFATTGELGNHRRTHENVRPYPCRYNCGKSFRHCSNRSTHERVHMDGSLRPFQCEYCEKTFVTQGDCRAHQAVHTTSRAFNCDICAQSFKMQKHYIQHLSTKSHKKLEASAES
ncbi:transcription factor Ouib [Drosophila busckii]|uniref:transcription factor Ouib n=1 Tax=Drosophila busckii TaxID=30019 RepID=UPI00083F4329|nr:transcription factor Ouib [Drosophila busckii]